MSNEKVVVGLSGGVDSAVTAFLMKREGYDVIGATALGFAAKGMLEDAQKVADFLNIPLEIVDLRKEFESSIMDYFVKEYLNGRTPNPCSFCNPNIKWKALMQIKDKYDADYIATGHYSRVDFLENGRFAIRNSESAQKDQTYALAFLSQENLASTLTPLGLYTKDEVREIASSNNLPVAGKHDSQDICFVPDKDYAAFICNYCRQKNMDMSNIDKAASYVTKEGKCLGSAKSVINYTIGQRKGLNLALGHPVFVTGIDAEKHQVVIGENEDLFTKVMFAGSINYMGGTREDLPRRLLCKVRYAHKGTMAYAQCEGDGKIKIEFDEPVRAVTPGQTMVLYDGEYVFAGGIIE